MINPGKISFALQFAESFGKILGLHLFGITGRLDVLFLSSIPVWGCHLAWQGSGEAAGLIGRLYRVDGSEPHKAAWIA